jgi:hypothetical protein
MPICSSAVLIFLINSICFSIFCLTSSSISISSFGASLSSIVFTGLILNISLIFTQPMMIVFAVLLCGLTFHLIVSLFSFSGSLLVTLEQPLIWLSLVFILLFFGYPHIRF